MGRAAPRGEHPIDCRPPRVDRGEAVNLRAFAVAAAVALTTFLLYRVTLLPGFDLGDTASFQTTVGERVITPRDGYPLYFAIGGLFLRLTGGGDPAHALNLLSAIAAAIACGIIVLAGAELSGSLPAGAAAALLLATSYTFWSQAIIAEVYALHLIFVSATLLLLLRWSNRPSLARLTLFFAVYALGFGNHLSMALLLPAYALFLLMAAPGGWRSMLTPRVVAIALACAAAGAVQYVWNLRTLWFQATPPHGLLDALQAFWFDVTKSDWRDTMVLRVPQSMLDDRAAMYWFDLRQQFGIIGAPLAVAGLAHLARVDIRRARVHVQRRGRACLLLAVASDRRAARRSGADVRSRAREAGSPRGRRPARPHGRVRRPRPPRQARSAHLSGPAHRTRAARHRPFAGDCLCHRSGLPRPAGARSLRRSQADRAARTADDGTRRSARRVPDRLQLADCQWPFVLRQSDPTRARVWPAAGRAALRAGACARQPHDRTRHRAERARPRGSERRVRTSIADGR
ncbi:MAG: hypothetical protein DMG03_08860 [Acidobacteria bacterium]|nr:MAG: hypothetical protein DMG03_08860 [Acidobacteriota bacterium]